MLAGALAAAVLVAGTLVLDAVVRFAAGFLAAVVLVVDLVVLDRVGIKGLLIVINNTLSANVFNFQHHSHRPSKQPNGIANATAAMLHSPV
ncbi:hypothetical protein [uncultured Tateyamaria sp.]|uniref:hypothetical protein n=1 Tax=Tateyamaria sp. 1078 TaxID=3417464 RepID=UPI0026251FE5|nr:hypothetical protein [uncultured Tateyamaria sp.]